jgi:uncharacterized protein (DUF1697 family)
VTRYVAFLGGINVGGHNVKMERLRELFEGLGLAGVSTFIASGNVIFESPEEAPAELERRIEAELGGALGYAVPTFLRTDAEVGRIAGYAPFPGLEAGERDRLYVLLLRGAPDGATAEMLLGLATERDFLHLHERELYWLCRGPTLESGIRGSDWARAGRRIGSTNRNVNTVRRLAERLGAG